MRVLIADDHAIVRYGLRALLEREGYTVVAEASDGREAVNTALRLKPDLTLLDIVMPVLNGIDAAREIHEAGNQGRIAVLTMHPGDRYALDALRAGVSAYILKTAGVEALLEGIREALAGRLYLSEGISRLVLDAFAGKPGILLDPLSPRERQVLQLIADGKGTKQVAAVLGVSVKTAESHRGRIMEKLDIHDTAGLVRYAIRQGLIEP